MFKPVSSFSGFSIDNKETAKKFYAEVLGLGVTDDDMGLHIKLPNNSTVFAYAKEDHQPASYTMLNFVVEDIDAAADELMGKGVTFERYKDMPGQDAKGIARGKAHNMGPDIAWFKDPAGNIISILQD